jgi:hypothetical protein
MQRGLETPRFGLIPQMVKQIEKNVLYTGVVTGSKDFGIFRQNP